MPRAALRLLKRQPRRVRDAIEAVLLTIDPRAVHYFPQLPQWIADQVQGRKPIERERKR